MVYVPGFLGLVQASGVADFDPSAAKPNRIVVSAQSAGSTPPSMVIHISRSLLFMISITYWSTVSITGAVIIVIITTAIIITAITIGSIMITTICTFTGTITV